MRADSALDVLLCPSPNHGVRQGARGIDMLLLHYTGMPDADGALTWLCQEESEVSAHYFVYEDGRIVQMVPEARRAWHAGAALWAGEADINGCSIGIEIANEGPEGQAPDFPRKQMKAVSALCQDIMTRHAISPERVLGHSDVAPGRKVDPGPFFDWARLAEDGVGLWIGAEAVSVDSRLKAGDRGDEVAAYQQGLADFGYGIEVSGLFCDVTETVTRAFQLHFRQDRIDGVADMPIRQLLSGLLQLRRSAR